jgi:alpha-tubulin suppressor-like RCC1 family protein
LDPRHRNALQVVSVDATTCARLRGGQILCWGFGERGELGNGLEKNSPTPVETGPVPRVARLSLSVDSYGLAVTTDGDVWGWGSGRTRVLKVDYGDLETPEPLGVDGVVQVATHTASCVILRSGRVACWGSNDGGDIAGLRWGDDVRTPIELPVIERAIAIKAGWRMFAIDQSGGLFDWGCWPSLCSLGTVVAVQPVSGTSQLTAADNGPLHSCALLPSGHVRCWGLDRGRWGEGVHGQGLFGVGSVPMGHVRFEDANDVASISDAIGLEVGSIFTCVVRAAGSVSCWGDNRYGQLGDGTTETRDVPVDVIGLE